MNNSIEKTTKLAEQFGYELVFHKPENCLLRFKRDEFRIDVWYSTWTIGINEKHEHAKFVRNVTIEYLAEVLANPHATL